jgi:hypothetical protein
MNERYEQLMAQAWIEFAPDAKAVTKRFAELIIRECANVADDGFGSAHFGLGITGQDLRDHFDVK